MINNKVTWKTRKSRTSILGNTNNCPAVESPHLPPCRGSIACGYIFFLSWLDSSRRPRTPLRGSSMTLRHAILGRSHMDEWSARCRDLYLTTHNINKRQTSMPPAGLEPTVPASEWPQTHTLDDGTTSTGGYMASSWTVQCRAITDTVRLSTHFGSWNKVCAV
jgi:hypothetical protein